jgi:hypothetical protein
MYDRVKLHLLPWLGMQMVILYLLHKNEENCVNTHPLKWRASRLVMEQGWTAPKMVDGQSWVVYVRELLFYSLILEVKVR